MKMPKSHPTFVEYLKGAAYKVPQKELTKHLKTVICSVLESLRLIFEAPRGKASLDLKF
jgi:hypothetical protein